jgi:hypothetical protein
MLQRADRPDPTERRDEHDAVIQINCRIHPGASSRLRRIATPASAHTYEYRLRDAESFAQSCDFDTLAQCQATSSGRGGDCYRDPFLSDTSGAHAYAPIRTPAQAVPSKNN